MTNTNVEMTNAWLANNARNAEQMARNEAVRRSRAEAAEARANKAAKKAADNAKKAQANAEKAAANAKKAQTNALIQNIKRQWINVLSSTMNRNEKKKKGTTIYRKASVKLHPNKGGTNENFRVLSNLFEEFKTYVNRN
jgi:membrane protein involved in colicin uptake